jgi:hypothetical protein
VTGPEPAPVIAGDDQALTALGETFGDEYDEFWIFDGEWGARHKHAADEDDVVTARSPDELDAALRADLARRQPC